MKTRFFLVAAVLFFAGLAQAKTASYKLSGPYVHHNLQIFLIHGPQQIEAQKYVTLTEAMEKKLVLVHETGQVSQLAIENTSNDVAVFIHSGDIVKGGRQDRVISLDVIIPPDSGKIPLSSFCVESGRWSQRGHEQAAIFASNTNMISSRALKIAAKHSRDQGEVWSNVAAQQAKLNENLRRMTGKGDLDVRSGKSASSMQLTLENEELKQTAEDYTKKLEGILEGRNDVIGFAFVINEEVNNADVYGRTDLFKALWPKLLKSAVVEAIAEFKTPGSPTPAARLQTISRIAAMFADAMKGKQETQDVNPRTRLVTRETGEHLLFETRDQKLAGNWVHRNFIKKPPAPPRIPENRQVPNHYLNDDNTYQQQRPLNPPPQRQQGR
jgi:hypothetical protein